MTGERKARLSSGTRLALAIVVSTVFVGVTTVGAITAVIYHAGTVEVEIDEEGGNRFSLSVPTTLVLAAIKFVPDEAFEDVAGELAMLWPVVRETCRELERCPDAVLVEVDGPRETVRVAKQGGSLVVDVRDGDNHVRVAVPIRTVDAVLDRFETISGL